MAKKITQLPAATSVLDTDLLAGVIDPGGSPDARKIAIAILFGTAPRTGWIADADTWVYASATTILITGNVVAKFPIGTKLQLTQTTVKYFTVIVAEILTGNTILTISGGSYTLVDAVISATYYSYANSPQGWPALTWTDYSAISTITGWSAYTVKKIFYKRIGKTIFVQFDLEGTSNNVVTTFTLPATSKADGMILQFPIYGQDTGTPLCTRLCVLLNGGATIICYPTAAGGNWTASGTKTIHGEFWYEVA